MSLTNEEKKQITITIKKEIKDFLNASTLKKFEDNIIDKIKYELNKGNLRGDINEIIVQMMAEFYYLMWSKKNQWQTTLKNKK